MTTGKKYVLILLLMTPFLAFSCNSSETPNTQVSKAATDMTKAAATHPPEIKSFHISPEAGVKDQWFQFSWETVDAASVIIEPPITDTQTDLPLTGVVAGQVSISTWYTLIAERNGIESRKRIWLDVSYPDGTYWRHPRGDQGNSGFTPFVGPSQAHIAWVFRTDSPILTVPVVALDGSVYLGSSNFYAINPDGSIKWKIDETLRSPAVRSDGTIYVMKGDEYYKPPVSIGALNASGFEMWSANIATFPSHVVEYVSGFYFGPFDTIVAGIKQRGPNGLNGQLLYFTQGGELFGQNFLGAVERMAVTNARNLLVYEERGDDNLRISNFPYEDSDKKVAVFGNFEDNEIWGYPVTTEDGIVYVRHRNSVIAYTNTGDKLWEVADIIGADYGAGPLALGPDGTIYALGYYKEFRLGGLRLMGIHPDGYIALVTPLMGGGERTTAHSLIVDGMGKIYTLTDTTLTVVDHDGILVWYYERTNDDFHDMILSRDGTLYVTGSHSLYAFREMS